MSYADLSPDVREIAERVLTRKQLAAYKLKANGMSERSMALHFGISRRAVRDRLAEADVKINKHLEEAA